MGDLPGKAGGTPALPAFDRNIVIHVTAGRDVRIETNKDDDQP